MTPARLVVTGAAIALVAVGGCTGETTPQPSIAPTTGAATGSASGAATGSATGSATGAGGEGACTEALQEGPLIDPSDSILGQPQPGEEPLPVVNLPRLDTCALSSTGDWIGRPLVVNFWASWCGPCRAEMPMLDQFAADNDGVVDLVGVTIDFRPDDATGFLEEVPVDFDSWFDPDGQVLGRDLSVRAMPTTLFVDPDGIVVHRHLGEITREQLDAAVAEHLAVDPA